MAKRGCKLQEFVAHASNVNCLNIGKKSSRLLVTGGEDQMVNLWAIGKPTSLLSLSGHTSPVESVTFDSSEVLVVSGASFGVIKLWDLEEAKILRTLTGHRSSCNALQFHPFGEFFASGSSDTSLKVWDVRKKGCIHTYKGHTRGISTIKFTPDGRWIVSGGADNAVKIWDLTAGKLLHEFKFHNGQIQCIDFHPLEFLLATGSADKTVKFWDLETFEMIGSAGPEATGVRSMSFHPDGKTLFCGLEDSLKVFSWEPIICHDSVDMGWSTLGDLNISDGKLLACSYYHNCVGVWAADTALFGPYAAGVTSRSDDDMQPKFDNQDIHALHKVGNTMKSPTVFSVPTHDDESPEIRNIYVDTSGSNKVTPKKTGSIDSSKLVVPLDSSDISSPSMKRSPEIAVHTRSNSQVTTREFTAPLVVPRKNLYAEKLVVATPPTNSTGMVLKPTHTRRASNVKYETEKLSVTTESTRFNSMLGGSNISPDPNSLSSLLPKNESTETVEDTHKDIGCVAEKFDRILMSEAPKRSSHGAESHSCSRPTSSSGKVNKVQLGRTRSLVERWEKKCSSDETLTNTSSPNQMPESNAPPCILKEQPETSGRESMSASDENVLEGLMQNHETFINSFNSRLVKLQVVRYFWQRSDVKGGLNAVGKLPDHSVQADVVSVLLEKMDIVSLELFSFLLPMLLGLLNSQIDRYTNVSLKMLLKLVAIFGPVIRMTMSASPFKGVDLHAEKRRECCSQCFIQLQKIKQIIPSVLRRGGLLAKYAQELDLLLQES